MASKNPMHFLKRTFKNLYFLMFLNGFMLASLCYFKMESSYENGLFLSIKKGIDARLDANDTPDSVVVKVMGMVNTLLSNRASLFSDAYTMGFKADVMAPTSVDLMTTRGACGSYSQVLARVLETYRYSVRIAQMKANGVFGAHNIVEVEMPSGWAVLDATFNVCFKRPDGHLASFEDVKNDWDYYSLQLPANYDRKYRYEDVRYTNWEKIPVLLPAIKKLIGFFIGSQKVNTLSIRTYFLQIYDVYFYITGLIYLPIFLFTFRRFVRTKVFPNKNIPITFRNLVKYARPPASYMQ